MIGVEGLHEKKKKDGLILDGGMLLTIQILCITLIKAYGVDPPDTQYGFEDEVSLSLRIHQQLMVCSV